MFIFHSRKQNPYLKKINSRSSQVSKGQESSPQCFRFLPKRSDVNNFQTPRLNSRYSTNLIPTTPQMKNEAAKVLATGLSNGT